MRQFHLVDFDFIHSLHSPTVATCCIKATVHSNWQKFFYSINKYYELLITWALIITHYHLDCIIHGSMQEFLQN